MYHSTLRASIVLVIFAIVCLTYLTSASTVKYVRAEVLVSDVDTISIASTSEPEASERELEVATTTEKAATTSAIAADTKMDELTDNNAGNDLDLESKSALDTESSAEEIFSVPFYSQFEDISQPEWRKIGCGIASLAMLIDFYTEAVPVDTLLNSGIGKGAYLDNAGWTHQGLINLAEDHGLTGQAVSYSDLPATEALEKLKKALKSGPVMVSVHYTFDPTNPIPHLVVVNGISGDRVYYNDPAEVSGGNSITTKKFLAAWKQRYIEIRKG